MEGCDLFGEGGKVEKVGEIGDVCGCFGWLVVVGCKCGRD